MLSYIGNLFGSHLDYVPNLSPVGHAAAYFPGNTDADAKALNYLDFLSDSAFREVSSSTGDQSDDINNEAGAWDPIFRAAIGRFQTSAGITADTWVGPQTRAALGAAVQFRNANPGVLPPPLPAVVPVVPGQVPAKPAVLPGVQPAAAKTSDDTLMYAGVAVGVLALAGLGWYALK